MLLVIFPLLLLIALSLIFVSLITMCLSVFPFGFILPGTLCASWTWLIISLLVFGKFSAIMSSNIFSSPFFLCLFSFWDPYNVNIGAFNVVPEVSGRLHFFSFFFLYPVLWPWLPPFCPPGHLSVLLPEQFCYGFFLVYCSPLFACSLVLVGLR